jgi:hypothetical protein
MGMPQREVTGWYFHFADAAAKLGQGNWEESGAILSPIAIGQSFTIFNFTLTRRLTLSGFAAALKI